MICSHLLCSIWRLESKTVASCCTIVMVVAQRRSLMRNAGCGLSNGEDGGGKGGRVRFKVRPLWLKVHGGIGVLLAQVVPTVCIGLKRWEAAKAMAEAVRRCQSLARMVGIRVESLCAIRKL